MDQEATMDFQALRAKFQDEDLLQKQPKLKPVLPNKPKVVPPPQSPTHYLPIGARPSLLTSINQSLESKTMVVPRVVFKDEKKESKMPLVHSNSKGKDNSEGKMKEGKDKTKKKTLDVSLSGQKQKKENGKDKRFSLGFPGAHKESTAELVPATPPPKATTPKKGFPGFRRSSKKNSVDAPADSILDTLSSDVPGRAPLIPVPSEFEDAPPQPDISTPNNLLPNISSLPDLGATLENTPPFIIPPSPDFSPPPAFIPNIPASKITPDSEKTETPVLLLSRPASQKEISAHSAVSTPPPSGTISSPISVVSTPSPAPAEPEIAAEANIESVKIATVAAPPPPVINPQSISESPKAQRPISALSALERAEDKSPGKRSHPSDHRIFSALEKARRKPMSPVTNATTPYSFTPPPDELPPPRSPTCSLLELPPIDYEDRAGSAFPLKPAEVNGLDHQLQGITEEGADAVPKLFMFPPSPLKKDVPDPSSVCLPPVKPFRPSTIPPPPPSVDHHELPLSPEHPETNIKDAPEFADVVSNAPSLELSKWGNGYYTGPDAPDGLKDSDYYRITVPGAEVHAHGGKYQENTPLAGSETEDGNDVYESTENVYEDISTAATKKKGKSENGKKRKGPPKNPYAVAAQEKLQYEEKIKTGRFSKSDKKALAETLDEKELKKKEKQRLEKEKKELKEKQERERKEQKEKEKKENEMKKTFKITGQEDAMYQAKVTVTTKGRKNDLPVKTGDMLSIIRTTNCPKGKWLARDSSNNYGYVAVDHVELDIKEMLELGKKTAISHKANSNVVDGETIRTRDSNHYRLSESFSDDSEEWTIDDDDPVSPTSEITDTFAPTGHSRTFSMPDMGYKDLSINHQHSQSDISAGGSNIQARHEALQKLTTFFHSTKPVEPAASSSSSTMIESPVVVKEEAVHPPEDNSTQEADVDQMPILPPPDLYA
ncbi:FYN-binding protein 1 isoform X2 [Channa argus]|uniref:FYN-binding protein 1 isoform X2 n=1 Tax=Channa argus TaxID=215402 RepID=UPI00352034E7